jgi:hypothetical protein
MRPSDSAERINSDSSSRELRGFLAGSIFVCLAIPSSLLAGLLPDPELGKLRAKRLRRVIVPIATP